MAHCRGDTEGTWVVLAILQATAGEFKGTKAPAMYIMAKRGSAAAVAPSAPSQPQSKGTDSPSSSSSSSRRSASAEDWLYMGQSNKIPQHEDADAIWQLLQLHVPELLQDSDGSSSSSGMTSREVYFMWGVPALGLPTAPEAAAQHSTLAAGSNGGSNGGSSGGCQPLSPEQQRQLVQLVWGEAGVQPEVAWQQGFVWNSTPGLEWGLTQLSGTQLGNHHLGFILRWHPAVFMPVYTHVQQDVAVLS
jgi:hypothetical protein